MTEAGRNDALRAQSAAAGFEGGGGAMSQGMWAPLEAGEDRKRMLLGRLQKASAHTLV